MYAACAFYILLMWIPGKKIHLFNHYHVTQIYLSRSLKKNVKIIIIETGKNMTMCTHLYAFSTICNRFPFRATLNASLPAVYVMVRVRRMSNLYSQTGP